MAYYCVLLFFLLEYGRPAAFFPPLMALHLNSIIPLVGTMLALKSKEGPSIGTVLSNPHILLLVAFLGLVGLSVLTSTLTLNAWNIFTGVLGFALISITIVVVGTDVRRLKGLFWILVIVHVIVAAENPDLLSSADRPVLNGAPFLGDGNDFALSVNIALPLALVLLFQAKGVLRKLLYTGVLLLFVFAIVATQSRGGTIALVVVALFYFLQSDRKLLTASIGIVAFGLVMATAPPSYFVRMADATNTQEGSAQGRIAAWKGAWQLALGSPVLGVGAGSFGPMYGAILKVPTQTAHSIYFLILGELGFPGVIVLISIIIGNLVANTRVKWQLRQRPPEQVRVHLQMLTATSASMLAYGVGGAFLSAAYYPHMYVLVGLLVANRRVASQALQADTATVPTASATRTISYHWALRPTLGPAASRLLR